MNLRYVRLYFVIRHAPKGEPSLIFCDPDGRVAATTDYNQAAVQAASFGGIVTNWSAFRSRILPLMPALPGMRIRTTIREQARVFRADFCVADSDLINLEDFGVRDGRLNTPHKTAAAQKRAHIWEEAE